MWGSVQHYLVPTSIARAVALKMKAGAKAAYLAGGTDLVPFHPEGITTLVSLARLPLGRIVKEKAGVRIGSTVTLQRLCETALLQGTAGEFLSRAAGSFPSRQFRNAATIGGCLAAARTDLDLLPALLVLDARVRLVGETRTEIPLARMFRIRLKQSLIESVFIPAPPAGTTCALERLGRKTPRDLPLGVVTASLRTENGVFREVRLAVSGFDGAPHRLPAAEAALSGRTPAQDGQGIIKAASAEASREIKPVDDFLASADYRREMCGVLLKRALTTVMG